MSGSIGLHGGGEFEPGDEPFLGALLDAAAPAVAERIKACLPATTTDPATLRIAIVPTAAARHRPEVAAAFGEAAFRRVAAAQGVAVRLDSVPVVDEASAAAPRLAARLAGADLVYLPGGDPDLIPTIFPDSAAWRAVLAAHARGAVIAGASAGAMALATWTWTPAGGLPGLGLVRGIMVVPHLDAVRLRDWEARLAGVVPQGHGVLGLAERTGIVRGEAAPGGSIWRVHGAGTVRWQPRSGVAVEAGDGSSLILPV